MLCSHGQTDWDWTGVVGAVFSVVNTTCSSHGLVLLALAQLPLTLAHYLTLIRGTK